MIAHVAVIVRDYDEAIEFYVNKLNFVVFADTVIDHQKRWILVGPKDKNSCKILLAKATNKEQQSRIGNQTGGRVFLFLYTTDFEKDYQNLIQNKVKILREPKIEEYGQIAVFADLYGNLWDLIEPKTIS